MKILQIYENIKLFFIIQEDYIQLLDFNILPPGNGLKNILLVSPSRVLKIIGILKTTPDQKLFDIDQETSNLKKT